MAKEGGQATEVVAGHTICRNGRLIQEWHGFTDSLCDSIPLVEEYFLLYRARVVPANAAAAAAAARERASTRR